MAEMEEGIVLDWRKFYIPSSDEEEEEVGKKVKKDPKLEVAKEEDDEVLTLESDDNDIVFVEIAGKKDTRKIFNGGVISDGGSDKEKSVVMTIEKQPASVEEGIVLDWRKFYVPSSDEEEEKVGKKVEEYPKLEVAKVEDDHEYEVLTLESDDDDIVFLENEGKKDTGKVLNGGVISDGGSDDEVLVVMTSENQPGPVDDSGTGKEIPPVVEKQTKEVVEETKEDFEPDDEEEAVQDIVQHSVIVEDVTGDLSHGEDDDEAEVVDVEGDGLKVAPTLERLQGEMTPPEKTEVMETPSEMEVECDVVVLEENVSLSQKTSSEDDDDILVLDDSTPSHDTVPVTGLPPNSSPSKQKSYQALQNLYKEFCKHNSALPQKRQRKVHTKLFKAYDEIAQSTADVHSKLATTVEKARVAIFCSEDKWVTLQKVLDYMKSQTCGDKDTSPDKEKPHCSSRPPPSPGPSPFKSSSSQTKFSNVDREEKRNALRMEYEKQLAKTMEEVRALETHEVDLDEDEESVFMVQDKCIRKLMKDFYTLCDVTHSSRLTGRHTQKKITLRKFSGCASIDRQLERMINARGILKPPDYCDVFNIVQGEASAAGLESDQVEEMSERLFQSIVNHIKKLREKELKESMVKWLPPPASLEERLILDGMDEEEQLNYYFDKDPANEDPELERKLRENAAQRRTELEVGEEFDRRAEEQSGDSDTEATEEEEEGQWEEDANIFEEELSEDDEPEAKKRKVCSTDV